MTKRATKYSNNSYQQLENRQLLAGDVAVILAGNSLILSGDNQDNEIILSTNNDGDIEITGANGTSVNGMDEVAVDAVIEDLRIFLRAGDDMVSVEDVDVAGNAIVRGGSGSDAIGFLRSDIGGNLRIDSGGQADFISVETVETGEDLVIISGGGEDTVGVDDSTINGRTNIRSGARHDRVVIRNSIHQSRVRISTSGGSDFVSADGLTVNGPANISLGGRADNLFVNQSDFNAPLLALGGGSNDILEVTGNSSFSSTPRTFSFEGSDVPGGLPQTDLVFTDLIESGARLGTIVELASMTPELSQLVGALQATGLDAALAGDGPFTVFAPLNSAFEEISTVVAGLSNDQLTDVLLFHVAVGEIFAEELVMMDDVETLLGQTFSVDTTDAVVLNANVTLAATDIRAKNGVVHLLNNVLVPVL